MVRNEALTLTALPDDVLVRIIQNLLSHSVLGLHAPFGTSQCPHLCALSATSRRLRKLISSVLGHHRISVRNLYCYTHSQVCQSQPCAERPQVFAKCRFCHEAVDMLVQSAIRSFSSTRTNTLCITPACHHDLLSLLSLAADRFCGLTSLRIGTPQAHSNPTTVGDTSDNLEHNESGTNDAELIASIVAEAMPRLTNLIRLSCQSPITQIFLSRMSSAQIAPSLRTLELALPSTELVPALVQFLSRPERVCKLRNISCSIRPRAPQPSQQTYVCEYLEHLNSRKRVDPTDVKSSEIEDVRGAHLATHLLVQLAASYINISSVYVSRRTSIDTPNESYGCGHCALDKNADIHQPFSPDVRHKLYCSNAMKPTVLRDGDSGACTYRVSFSSSTAYRDVLNGILPRRSSLECIVASENIARVVKPTAGFLLRDDDGCSRHPIVAASLRSLFRCFPPRFDQYGETEDLTRLRMLDVATTTVEKDPFSSVPSVMQVLQSGEAGELDSILRTIGNTLDSIRVRPFPRAWHHAQEADKSLTLRLLYSAPRIRVFDVYICVLCSFLRQSRLSKLFVHMSHLQVLHVSESCPGRDPSTTIEQPDVITALRTIPRLLSALTKSCDTLRLVLWHATHTCRLQCTGCTKSASVGSLTPSFGSPLGHADHALQRFGEKRPHVNTESLRSCLDSLYISNKK